MGDAHMKEVLGSFSQLTHINIAAYDAQFRCIYTMINSIRYCSAIHASKACLSCCIQSDIAALRRAKETGEPHVYTCPFGLCEAIFPVRGEGEIVGYLIVGPTLQASSAASDRDLCRMALSRSADLNGDILLAGAAELIHLSDGELAALNRLVLILRDHIESNRLLTQDRKTLGQLIKYYVKKNLNQKITLSKMSKNLHCSTVTLTQAFRREFGTTIMEYVLAERMALARTLLATTASITEIAGRCGFADVEYFSKCFKRENEGRSPSEWRKKQGALQENAAVFEAQQPQL